MGPAIRPSKAREKKIEREKMKRFFLSLFFFFFAPAQRPDRRLLFQKTYIVNSLRGGGGGGGSQYVEVCPGENFPFKLWRLECLHSY